MLMHSVRFVLELNLIYEFSPIKPQYAFASATFDDGVSDIDVDVDSAWILGATYNFPLGGNWGLAANLDYFTFKLEDIDDSYSMMKFSVGVQYKF